MAKIVSMTADEIRKTEDADAAFERAKKSKPMPVPPGGTLVATGFAAFKEHIGSGNSEHEIKATILYLSP